MNININEILFQLGIGSKETVYMSVSPRVGLEVIKVDTTTKTITAYANRPLEYNESLREITDYEEFKNTVKDLFDELHISLHCNIILSLPMVLFGTKEIPLILGDDAINEVLISEVEQTYTFKRHDPLVAWMDANSKPGGENRRVFYSALQRDVVDNIKTALAEIGATLVGVKTSLSSAINALYFSGLVEDQMQENSQWNLLLVGTNGYSICSMQGSRIIDYFEEPLALKSFDSDELYNAITSSIQLALMNYPANFTYIISNTDLVSAQILSSRISGEGGVVGFLENNIYRKDEFIATSLEILPDLASNITLEALGVAVSLMPNLPMQMNFMDNYSGGGVVDDDSPVVIRVGEKEFEITPQAALKIVTVVIAVLIVPILALNILLPLAKNNVQKKLDTITEQAKTLEDEVKKYSDEEAQLDSFNVKREIQETLKYNRMKLMTYSALGEAVPKGLWVTYFFTQKDGKIDIKGASTNVEDVYTFYKNLKDYLINTKLRLYRLEMATNNIEDAVENSQQTYIFEITNMSEAELQALAATGQEGTEQAAAGGQNAAQDAAKSNQPTNPQPRSKSSDTDGKKNDAAVPKTLPIGL